MGFSLRGVPKLNEISQGLFLLILVAFGGGSDRGTPSCRGTITPLISGLDVNKHFCHTGQG